MGIPSFLEFNMHCGHNIIAPVFIHRSTKDCSVPQFHPIHVAGIKVKAYLGFAGVTKCTCRTKAWMKNA